MYIGDVDEKGLHHLVWEIIDNAVDEYLNGFADSITVTLDETGEGVTVADNGRGIPVDIHPEEKIPALELILTTLHSGAKFDSGEDYFYAGGLHGVGSSVVNALSQRLIATIRRDGGEWEQTFERGIPKTKLKGKGAARGHGTQIYFEPDPEIFKKVRFNNELIRRHLEDMSYIHSGLKITFKDETTGETHDLTHPGGIPEFLSRLVTEGERTPVTESALLIARKEGDEIEIALQWTEASNEEIHSFVNGIRTELGGTHVNGFRDAISKAIRNYIETHDIKVKGLVITADDIREGVVGILSVFVRNPMFQGQTKERLNNPEMRAIVDGFVRPALEAWLNGNRTAADQIIGRIVVAARTRLAKREATEEVRRKSPTSRRLSLPGKLADCKSTSLDETELLIVEGDSAGGSAKQGRDNRTQAVLPLRGKILNSEGLTLSKVLTNQELNDLVSAIGTGAGDKFNINGLRYGRIILLMDADADGHHITTLMLAFFFRHMPELIKRGHVFLAQPPLYRIDVGKETFWARDDEHKAEIIAGLRPNAKYEVSRFKGLGEMDPAVLKETTLDPRHRTMVQVEIDSLLDADKMFVDLLGKEPAQRYRFIMECAALAAAEELDI
jgi:DNA gyrase/topoisomerase IV subunit B